MCFWEGKLIPAAGGGSVRGGKGNFQNTQPFSFLTWNAACSLCLKQNCQRGEKKVTLGSASLHQTFLLDHLISFSLQLCEASTEWSFRRWRSADGAAKLGEVGELHAPQLGVPSGH